MTVKVFSSVAAADVANHFRSILTTKTYLDKVASGDLDIDRLLALDDPALESQLRVIPLIKTID